MRPPARPHHRGTVFRALAGLGALVCALAANGPLRAATLVITVQTADGHALQGAVVTAHPLEGPARKPQPIKAVMDQINRAFAPDLLVIPVGSTVTFPNSDSVSHQIYSFSPAKRFQLPLYRGTPYPPVHFDQAGVVTLGCNIHDEMIGYLVVTDAPYYGRTDAQGAWSNELARGRYRITIWHPRMRDEGADLERELTIGEADHAELTLRLTRSLTPAPLAERPHSWDY
ncbi:MAG TPA: methylamine utilization protein [Steroidobacteraceae bacterium]|nr:methylamine utilization protein [Steroidobacteraceae bacterium]